MRIPRATRQMVVSIAGRRMYMWRAVDSEGEVLDVMVQPRRDKAAAGEAAQETAEAAGLRADRHCH